MKVAKAKRLMKMVVAYLEKARFPVTIDFTRYHRATGLHMPIGFIDLSGLMVPIDETYPVRASRNIVINKKLIRDSQWETLKNFWMQFLQIIPKKSMVLLVDENQLWESVQKWESFDEFYYHWEVRVKVKIGRVERNCAGKVDFSALISIEKARQIWTTCVAPLETEPR